MKSLIRSIGIAAGIVLLVGVPHAGAQIVNTVEFTTPFPFTVGAATLPAGSYTIRPDDETRTSFNGWGCTEVFLGRPMCQRFARGRRKLCSTLWRAYV